MRSAAMKLTLMTTILAGAASALAGCSSDDSSIPPPATDAGLDGASDAKTTDATTDAGTASDGATSDAGDAAATNDGSTDGAATTHTLADVGHVIVFYMENHSFDNLYGTYTGAEGLPATVTNPQIDVDGGAYTTLPQKDLNLGALPNAPFDITKFYAINQKTIDLWHRWYQEQMQINGGKMNRFVRDSDALGLSYGYFPTDKVPMTAYLKSLGNEATLCDHFFHAAFGGSFLNHQWLIAAATPTFPSAPDVLGVKARVPDGTEKASQIYVTTADGVRLTDGFITPDNLVVNTAYSVNHPQPTLGTDPHSAAYSANLIPNQTSATIGDRLTAKNVDWAWYSGGWNDALAGHADASYFQFHHQPFIYFQNFADGTSAKAAHLKDESDFRAAVAAGNLPPVSFVKPIGYNNEHPGYADLATGDQHLVDMISEVRASPIYKDTVIIVTYDENGGQWDHVAPPTAATVGAQADKFGPGTRVPGIVISPFAKGGVDKTSYDTTAILKLIEKRWGLDALGTRDAAQNDISANALKLQ